MSSRKNEHKTYMTYLFNEFLNPVGHINLKSQFFMKSIGLKSFHKIVQLNF